MILLLSLAFAAPTTRTCTAADNPPAGMVGADTGTGSAAPVIQATGGGSGVKIPWTTSFDTFYIYNSALANAYVISTDSGATLPRCVVIDDPLAELDAILLLTSSRADTVTTYDPTTNFPLSGPNVVAVYGRRGNDTLLGDSDPGGPTQILVGGSDADVISASGDELCLIGPDLDDGVLLTWLAQPVWARDLFDVCVGTAPSVSYPDKVDVISGWAEYGYMWGGDGADILTFNALISGFTTDLAVFGDYDSPTSGSGDGIYCEAHDCFVEGGGGGDSIITVGGGFATINGDDGGDVIDCDHTCNVTGGSGNDTITGFDRVDNIDGGDGEDTIYGGLSGDIINGGDNPDFLYGEDGFDVIHGDGGGDTIEGGAGNDRLFGDAGPDVLSDSVGSDLLVGGDEDDELFGQGGSDTLCGGAENDRYHAEGSNNKLLHTLKSDAWTGSPILPSDPSERPTYSVAGTGAGNLCTMILHQQDGAGANVNFGSGTAADPGNCTPWFNFMPAHPDITSNCVSP